MVEDTKIVQLEPMDSTLRKRNREGVINSLKDALKDAQECESIDTVFIIAASHSNKELKINRYWGGSADNIEMIGILDIAKTEQKSWLRGR